MMLLMINVYEGHTTNIIWLQNTFNFLQHKTYLQNTASNIVTHCILLSMLKSNMEDI
jgi:hypothetical protein